MIRELDVSLNLVVNPVMRFWGLSIEDCCEDETNFLLNNIFSGLSNGSKKNMFVLLWNTLIYIVAGNNWEAKPNHLHPCIIRRGNGTPHGRRPPVDEIVEPDCLYILVAKKK